MLNIDILEYLKKHSKLIAIKLLFVWISFFPCPIQQKYHLATKVFLIFTFVVLLIEKRSSIFKPSDFPLWIFLVAIGINVFFAQYKAIAIRTYLDLAIPIFVIYYLLSEGLFLKTELNILAKTISIVSGLVALGGILELLFKVNPLYEHLIKNPYYSRFIFSIVQPMSTQYHPSPLGTYLLGCLPFNWLLIREKKFSFRLLGAICAILAIAVIILTFSKGAILGLIGMGLFYLFVKRKYRAINIFLILVCIFIAICSYRPYPFNQLGVNGLVQWKRGWGIFSSYRLDRCIMAQRIIRDHPLTGIGFQHFRINFYKYSLYKYYIPYEFRIIDNMYLTILAETGIIGFSGFLILILSLLKKGLKQLRTLKYNDSERQWLAVFLSGFVGLSINLAGYELFYWPNQYILFCFILGILGVLVNRQPLRRNS